MNILHTIGLMTRAEHEAVKLQAAADKQLIERIKEQLDAADRTIGKLYNERDDALGKFKRAATDLAAQAEEIARLEADRDRWRKDCLAIIEEADALRPDAEAMRKKRAADRKGMAGKRGKNNG